MRKSEKLRSYPELFQTNRNLIRGLDSLYHFIKRQNFKYSFTVKNDSQFQLCALPEQSQQQRISMGASVSQRIESGLDLAENVGSNPTRGSQSTPRSVNNFTDLAPNLLNQMQNALLASPFWVGHYLREYSPNQFLLHLVE